LGGVRGALRGGGLYVLVFRLVEPYVGGVGRRWAVALPSGVYVYVGSAWGPGGLAARLRRHVCRGARRLWWHVDYLAVWRGFLPVAAVVCLGAWRWLEPFLAAVFASSRLFVPLGGGLGGGDDELGFGHFFVYVGGGDAVGAAAGVAAGLPCVPLVVEPGPLCVGENV